MVLLWLASLLFGSVTISWSDFWQALIGNPTQKSDALILWNYRLPKSLTAILVGAGLGISGLLMQTFFRNALAGPYVLGISSGASLGVALLVMGSIGLSVAVLNAWTLMIAAALGSFLVLLLILLVSKKMEDPTTLLIIGLMFGSFTGAVVGILAYFSSAEALQKFTLWSMGSLHQMSWEGVVILSTTVFVGLVLAYSQMKSLNLMLLGKNYAISMGVSWKNFQQIVLLSTAILAGSITAFVGPIAFIGLSVPHLARLMFQTSQHQVLFWASILIGACLLLLCDLIAQVPGYALTLPINAVTSIIGAPMVVWLIMRQKKLTI